MTRIPLERKPALIRHFAVERHLSIGGRANVRDFPSELDLAFRNAVSNPESPFHSKTQIGRESRAGGFIASSGRRWELHLNVAIRRHHRFCTWLRRRRWLDSRWRRS